MGESHSNDAASLHQPQVFNRFDGVVVAIPNLNTLVAERLRDSSGVVSIGGK